MMNLLKNLSLLCVLAIAFSVMTGCTNQSAKNGENSTAVNGSTETANFTAAPANSPTASSQYPPIPSALAQMDVKKIDESTFRLEEKKGNVVLLNLWATWCGPCRSEMPHLVEMEETYKSKNFQVIGLNTDDESVEAINSFAKSMNLNYEMAYADQSMMREFLNISKFQGIPQSFLIDRNGNLRGVFLGGGPKVINTMKETVEKVVSE